MTPLSHSNKLPTPFSDTTDYSSHIDNLTINVNKHSNPEQTIAAPGNVDVEDNFTPQMSQRAHRRFKTARFHPGQRIKDSWTHTTHEERETKRIVHNERVRLTHEATERAMATGERQLVGKAEDGHEIYIDPPSYSQYNTYSSNGYGYGYGYGGFGFPSILLGSLLLGGLWW